MSVEIAQIAARKLRLEDEEIVVLELLEPTAGPFGEIAGQLADCGARMLLTAPPLAATALAAADRSWVRQVISFGDAPGATSFDALLSSGSLQHAGGRYGDPVLLPYVRQPDGMLSPVAVTQQELAAELGRFADRETIGEQDVVITVPPAGDGRAYSVLLDHALLGGATVVASPVADLLATAVAWRGTVAVRRRAPSGCSSPRPPRCDRPRWPAGERAAPGRHLARPDRRA